mgnify:CR=1 FL=1
MEGQKSGCISPASYDFIVPLHMRILMVCLGNICRSPLADGILRNKVSHRQLPWMVDSAGTAAYHIGNPPDLRMIQTAKANGIDISGLRARQFTSQDFEDFDLIYAMDKANYKEIISLLLKNQLRFSFAHFQNSNNLQEMEIVDSHNLTTKSWVELQPLLEYLSRRFSQFQHLFQV